MRFNRFRFMLVQPDSTHHGSSDNSLVGTDRSPTSNPCLVGVLLTIRLRQCCWISRWGLDAESDYFLLVAPLIDG